jgi:CheY-like chemotaxis protein
MNVSCELHAVVVSSDPSVLDSMSTCLGQLGISAVFHARSEAIEMLTNRKMDAFFVDQDIDPEFSVIERVRASSSSRNAVTFAIVPRSGPGRMPFGGANFVIEKPISREHLNRSLRAAYGLMLKERRQYTRYGLRCEATLEDSTRRKFHAATTNVSQTGISLDCAAPLIAGETVKLKFRLPHNPAMCHFRGQVIWTAQNGKAGLAFTHMSATDRERLTEWIDGEFLRQWHPVIPEGVAERFVYAAR